MDDRDKILATRFGIFNGDGLQTRSSAHGHCRSFRCVLCGGWDDMALASITLFDGQEQLGDLCRDCVVAGAEAAAARAHRRAMDLREQAEGLDDLAKDLRTLDPARWSTLAELNAEHEQMRQEMGNGGAAMFHF